MTTEPRPLQPWLHDLAIVVRGNATCLSAASGEVTGDGAQGLWVDDRRLLSELQVEVGGAAISPIAHRAVGDSAEFLGAARLLAPLTPDPAVQVARRRSMHDRDLIEDVRVVNRTLEPVRTTVAISVAADDQDIAAAKAGVGPGPLVEPWVFCHVGQISSSTHEVTVNTSPTADRLEVCNGRLRFEFDVEVAGGAHVDLALVATYKRLTSSAFDADPATALGWSQLTVTSADPRLAPAVEHSLTDLGALLMNDPLERRDAFAGAGSPWYLTLFGRDSIWAALMSLPLGTDLAGGTLRALARRQGSKIDAVSAEEPGKILHEVRRSVFHDPVTGASLPVVYYGSVDATALWIILLRAAQRWGLPTDEVQALSGPLELATRWLVEAINADDEGLLRYRDGSGSGLANQGWKDSADSIRFRDGRIASGPIALVEAQAYAVQALREAADMLAEHDAAPDLRQEALAVAQRLSATIADRFWTEQGHLRYLGLALDGRGRLADALGSNMGHVLGRGVLDDAEVTQVAAALADAELTDAFGLRTYGTGNGGYNPIGYHTGSIWTHDTAIAALGLAQEGRADEAVTLVDGLLASAQAFDYRWPELYSGDQTMGLPAPYPASCRPQAWSAASGVALVSVLLGLQADAANGVLTVRPAAPERFGPLRVTGLRFGGGRVDLRVERDGTLVVEQAPPGVTVVDARAGSGS